MSAHLPLATKHAFNPPPSVPVPFGTGSYCSVYSITNAYVSGNTNFYIAVGAVFNSAGQGSAAYWTVQSTGAGLGEGSAPTVAGPYYLSLSVTSPATSSVVTAAFVNANGDIEAFGTVSTGSGGGAGAGAARREGSSERKPVGGGGGGGSTTPYCLIYKNHGTVAAPSYTSYPYAIGGSQALPAGINTVNAVGNYSTGAWNSPTFTGAWTMNLSWLYNYSTPYPTITSGVATASGAYPITALDENTSDFACGSSGPPGCNVFAYSATSQSWSFSVTAAEVPWGIPPISMSEPTINSLHRNSSSGGNYPIPELAELRALARCQACSGTTPMLL
jgi:hypothetical protein